MSENQTKMVGFSTFFDLFQVIKNKKKSSGRARTIHKTLVVVIPIILIVIISFFYFLDNHANASHIDD